MLLWPVQKEQRWSGNGIIEHSYDSATRMLTVQTVQLSALAVVQVRGGPDVGRHTSHTPCCPQLLASAVVTPCLHMVTHVLTDAHMLAGVFSYPCALCLHACVEIALASLSLQLPGDAP